MFCLLCEDESRGELLYEGYCATCTCQLAEHREDVVRNKAIIKEIDSLLKYPD